MQGNQHPTVLEQLQGLAGLAKFHWEQYRASKTSAPVAVLLAGGNTLFYGYMALMNNVTDAVGVVCSKYTK